MYAFLHLMDLAASISFIGICWLLANAGTREA